MKSCIYVGCVHHRRCGPQPHAFRQRLFMMLLDLDELPALFDRFWLWSARAPAPAWFRRQDYYGNPAQSLSEAVRGLVKEKTGVWPRGPIRLLTHLRYFGHNFNPVSFYYVYDATDSRIESIVAEITNTPWKERHAYVLPVHEGSEDLRWQFEKQFHVSPFMPMRQQYSWRFTAPGDSLCVHMRNQERGELMFDATLNLARRPLNGINLARALLGFPVMTLQVVLMIHWQALRLLLKRTPWFTHPAKNG